MIAVNALGFEAGQKFGRRLAVSFFGSAADGDQDHLPSVIVHIIKNAVVSNAQTILRQPLEQNKFAMQGFEFLPERSGIQGKIFNGGNDLSLIVFGKL